MESTGSFPYNRSQSRHRCLTNILPPNNEKVKSFLFFGEFVTIPRENVHLDITLSAVSSCGQGVRLFGEDENMGPGHSGVGSPMDGALCRLGLSLDSTAIQRRPGCRITSAPSNTTGPPGGSCCHCLCLPELPGPLGPRIKHRSFGSLGHLFQDLTGLGSRPPFLRTPCERQ